MTPSRHPGRSRSTLVILVLISVTVITLDFRGFGPLDSLKSGANAVLSPFRAVGDAVFGPIGSAWEGIFGGSDLEDENRRLRRENDELRGAAAAGEEAQAQLDQLREDLDLLPRSDIPKTHAEVVGGISSNFDRTMRINKGTNAGIRRGNPVVTAAGLVGRVVEVSFNEATVQLITDTGFRLGVRHAPERDTGVARGRGAGEPLLVDVGLSVDSSIREDDVFTTTEVDRALFPSGIPVGKVVRLVTGEEDEEATVDGVDSNANPLEQVVEIEPLADLDNLDFVSVLRWVPED